VLYGDGGGASGAEGSEQRRSTKWREAVGIVPDGGDDVGRSRLKDCLALPMEWRGSVSRCDEHTKRIYASVEGKKKAWRYIVQTMPEHMRAQVECAYRSGGAGRVRWIAVSPEIRMSCTSKYHDLEKSTARGKTFVGWKGAPGGETIRAWINRGQWTNYGVSRDRAQ